MALTLRTAAHELLGKDATETLLAATSPEWLVFTLMAYIEANNIQTETAAILRAWHDRRHATPPSRPEDAPEGGKR